MASIYVSSTFRDLQAHRKAVSDQLQRMNHAVKAMEAYVARDDRPTDVCTRDIAASDLYIGLFAWRYGYVPPKDNPECLSITELEYRAAKRIPRLVFLLDEAVAWAPNEFDSHTGEGDGGARIRNLRKRLGDDHTPARFTSPDDLAAKVGAAVHLAGALADASDASLDLANIVGQDAIDRPEMLFNQSYVPYLVQRFAELGNTRLLKIDLRDGQYWWSTRLYALAALTHEYSSVEWLLFLDRGTDFVGMVRPGDLRRALGSALPELQQAYNEAQSRSTASRMDSTQRAGEMVEAFVAALAARPGGEQSLVLRVDSAWLKANVPGLSTVHVERAGEFDLLATFQLLDAPTPFVPITKGGRLLKVIDRIGVATEIARSVVERRLGRA